MWLLLSLGVEDEPFAIIEAELVDMVLVDAISLGELR